MSLPVYTVGHSTRSIDGFVALLRAGTVELVVDIRTVPRSRTNPQFNRDVLGASLAPHAIGYARIEALGGLRKRSAGVAPEVNAFWTNRSFHNYADHALSDGFRRGLDELLDLASERPTAIMCAEAVWWRCHRRIVADYLIDSGRAVFHLMEGPRADPARLTPAAARGQGGLIYPAA
jgi:uncharacterized protein (DUF488 family)